MLKTLKNVYFHVTKKLFDAVDPHKRSPEWGKLEHAFVKAYPTCAACGATTKLQVHHKHPFHIHPELELDPNNLVTLCMEVGKECHLYVGHGDSWRAYNPNLEADLVTLNNDPSARTIIIAEAKKNRLMQ